MEFETCAPGGVEDLRLGYSAGCPIETFFSLGRGAE
jgi:hypothetical protein